MTLAGCTAGASAMLIGTASVTGAFDPIAGVTVSWTDLTSGSAGSLIATANDGAFDETFEDITATGNPVGTPGSIVRLRSTVTTHAGATASDTDYCGDFVGPVTSGSLGSQTGITFNRYTGTATDAQLPIMEVQYRLLNADGSTRIPFTPLPPADGSYNEKSETIDFTIDVTALSAGTYIVGVRSIDAAGNFGPTDSEQMIYAGTPPPPPPPPGSDTSAPSCSGTASQSSFNIVVTGLAQDDRAVSLVEVKIQRLDAGAWTDLIGYVAALANDGTFNEASEPYSYSTGLTQPNGLLLRGASRVTDTSGNTATCVSNTVSWTSTPVGGDVTAPVVTVTTSTLTPTSSATVTFTGVATDNIGVTNVEFAVTRVGSGTTVQGFVSCNSNDGTFSEVNESFTCSFTFPAGFTAQGGDAFVFLVRARDAAGNAGFPADATTGAESADQDCDFFTQQSGGAAETGTCAFTYDNRAPFIAVSTNTTDANVIGVIDVGDVLTFTFPEEMRAASVTTPQSITLTDGVDAVTLTNGLSATFTRTANFGGSSAWTVVPTVTTAVNLPATITGINNFRDWAGNQTGLIGDLIIP